MLLIVVQASPPTPVLECTLRDDPADRVFRVVDAASRREPRWWLTLRSRSLGERVVELPLSNACVERLADRLAVSSASNNGGLAVEISVSRDRPILDVFVNYEL